MKHKRAEKTRAMTRAVLSAVVLVFPGVVLWPPLAVAQTVRYVDNIGSCEGLTPCYTTIMDAVNAAQSSDTVEVFPGVYPETVSIVSRGNIVLRAHDATLKPVISPSSGNAGVMINASPRIEVLDFVIEGDVQIGSPASTGYVIHGNWIRGSVSSHAARGGAVTDNTFVGGGLAGDLNSSHIEGNTFVHGGIRLSELSQRPDDNVIRDNVLRGGGIILDAPAPAGNTIESNFVSGNAGDGIRIGVALQGGGVNVIRDNTSIENSGCDINDLGNDNGNTWTNNRFATKCGHATD